MLFSSNFIIIIPPNNVRASVRPCVRASVRSITQILFDGLPSNFLGWTLMMIEVLLEIFFSNRSSVSKWRPFKSLKMAFFVIFASVRSITQIPFVESTSNFIRWCLMIIGVLLENIFSKWPSVSKWPPFFRKKIAEIFFCSFFDSGKNKLFSKNFPLKIFPPKKLSHFLEKKFQK